MTSDEPQKSKVTLVQGENGQANAVPSDSHQFSTVNEAGGWTTDEGRRNAQNLAEHKSASPSGSSSRDQKEQNDSGADLRGTYLQEKFGISNEEYMGAVGEHLVDEAKAHATMFAAGGMLAKVGKGGNVRGFGGTGASYDKKNGQGIYILLDKKGNVKYVGRGDVVARLAKHAQSSKLGGFDQVVVRNNNLTKAQAKGLENVLIGKFGGAKSVNPATNLMNKIRSFSPSNKNAGNYKNAASPELVNDALQTIQRARKAQQ